MRLDGYPALRLAKSALPLLGLLTLAIPNVAHSAAPAPKTAPQTAPVRIVIFILPQGDPKKPRKDDPALALRDAIRETLRESGRYEPITFDPALSAIKRAALEKRIEPGDITPPQSPETMQRIAKALDARIALQVTPQNAPKGYVAQMRLWEMSGPQTWNSVLSDGLSTGEVMGEKRYQGGDRNFSVKIGKPEAIAILADQVTTRMGLPSRLNDALKAALAAPPPKNGAAKPKDPPKQVAKKQEETPSVENNPPVTPEATQNPSAPPKNVTPKNPPEKAVKPQKTDGGNPNPVTPPNRNARPPKNEPPVIPAGNPNGAGADIVTNPEQLPLNVQKTDSEEQLKRYRQDGDLANVILSLRKTLNERPADLTLRLQLIQAYQDRGLTDAAQSEAERAMQQNPNDTALHRLYGNVLFNTGNIAGALKAYREAIKNDPKNVLAQVALGDALLADNQYKEAFEAYDQARKNAPESPLPFRRLARALASRAAADLKAYDASIEAILKARNLTPPSDTETYIEDYIALMRLLESRLRDMHGEVQNSYEGLKQGKIKIPELNRALADIKERAKAAEDYLEKLPPAISQEVTHIRYQQGAAFLSQAISLFRAYLQDGDASTESALRTAQVSASRELNAASMKLAAARNRKAASDEKP